MSARGARVKPESPCVQICQLDERSGWCIGCGRSGVEIAGWLSFDDAARRKVISILPTRMELLSELAGDEFETESQMTTDIVSISCPYCAERFDVIIDPSVPEQSYIEDCFVCCRPISLNVRVDEDDVSVDARAENDA